MGPKLQKKKQVQSGEVACQRPRSEGAMELGFKARSLCPPI